MSASESQDEDGEGYFASISDLMVGILFVFLLMLTVFALNFKDAEDDQKVAREQYEKLLADEAAAERRAEQKEKEADIEKHAAEDERQKNAHLRDLLRKAVARMSQDIEDRQNARLRLLASLERTLKDEGVTVIIDPDSGVLRLPESLLFEKSQSTLGGGPDAPPAKRQAAQEALKKVSDALASVLPCYVATDARAGCEARDRATLEGVLIEGHSDRQPYREPGRTLSAEESRDRNDRLSVERALTVFKEIQQNKALDEIRNVNGLRVLAVSAYGDRRPVANRDSEEDYQKNRRIDLRFLLSARTSEELQRLIDEIKPALGDAP
jgi:flagellar motor protein MotB